MKIFAHRGASGQYPENTLLAFRQAIKQGCDGIELDVQYHPSGELILAHDSFLSAHQLKTTSITAPCKLQNIALAELLSVPVGQDQTLCTLNQALALINGQCEVNIEIKPAYLEVANIAQVVDQVSQAILTSINSGQFQIEQFIVSSFNHQIIQQIKHLHPKLKIAALIASCPQDLMAFTEALDLYAVNMAIDCTNQAMIDDAHQRGLLVGVYTVDFLADIKQCQHWQVDYIFSNYPLQARQFSLS